VSLTASAQATTNRPPHAAPPDGVLRLAAGRNLGGHVASYGYAGDVSLSATTVFGGAAPPFGLAGLGPVMFGSAFMLGWPLTNWFVTALIMAVSLPLNYIFVHQLLAHRRQRRFRKVHQFAGGIVVVDRSLQPHVIAWDDIEFYSHTVRHMSPRAAVIGGTPRVGTYHSYAIITAHRRLFTMDNEFRDTGPLAEALDREVGPRLVDLMETSLAMGQDVMLGAVTVTTAGVQAGYTLSSADILLWSEVERVEYGSALRMFRPGRLSPAIHVPADQIDWFPLLRILLDRRLHAHRP
jgi:hypothetical protein